jgi:hypothetical protein
VKALDAALRKGSYTPALWKAHTGEDLATLWEAYVAQQGSGVGGA